MPEPEERILICDAPERVDAFIASHTELTRSFVKKRILEGDVTVAGETVRPNTVLRSGDTVRIVLPAPKETGLEAEEIPLSVVYEDSDLIVIDKPQGMVVHPAPGHASGTLVNALLSHCESLPVIGGEQRPGIVHRIDRMTSGLLVVAKNDAAMNSLSAQFKNRTAHRQYLAVCDGNLKEDSGTVNAPIGRHPSDRKKMAVVPNGRDAVTHWRVLWRFGSHTLLHLRLETGRTHQIRVHMAYIHHPLTGDDVYGAAKNRFGLEGQALHGYRLSFAHPATGKRMVFTSPVPESFMRLLHRLDPELDPETVFGLLMRPLPDGEEDE